MRASSGISIFVSLKSVARVGPPKIGSFGAGEDVDVSEPSTIRGVTLVENAV